ncbi:CDP-diacylglycerol--serine O-phosphatidyltransferase [bacterium]|nr:CDP-diacylglycerol--serine O-phosphatidyltransferase [bacterium]
MRHLANILTSLNLVFGFTSMMLSVDGHIVGAAWLIALAVVMDAFDGKAARFFGASSPLGLQFDSLADVVSMGVAPSLLCYSAAFRDQSEYGMIVCTIPVLAAAYRLARFNVRAASRSPGYEGLTSPLHACLVSTYILMNYAIWDEVMYVQVLTSLLILTSVLMISKLPFAGLPRFSLREQGKNTAKLVVLAGSIAVGVINPPLFAFPVVVLLCLLSLTFGFLHIRRHIHVLEDDEATESLNTGWKKP